MNVLSPADNLIFLCFATSRRQQERRMALVQQDESDPQRNRALSMKRPISERKLQASRANAKRSTGPKTEAGKAASCRNALKHRILSRALDLPLATPGLDLDSPTENGSIVSEVLGRDSALQEISRIWGKLTDRRRVSEE
jgi:hypothetical protein